MGNIFSVNGSRGATHPETNAKNKNKTTMSQTSEDKCDVNVDVVVQNENIENGEMSATSEARKLSPLKERELEEFRKDLAKKREARKKIIKEKSEEMNSLKEQLEIERASKQQLIEENNRLKHLLSINNTDGVNSNVSDEETSRSDDNQLRLAVGDMENQVEQMKDQMRDIRSELCDSNLSLQNANAELVLLNKENVELRKQIQALKDVNRFSKEMMNIREIQITQLREKLTVIEESLADREMRAMSTQLKQEYERQLQNIRNLRVMYEERARLAEMTRLSLVRELELRNADNENLVEKNAELEEKNKELENIIGEKVDLISSQESQLGICKAEIRELQAEMSVINKLFSQMLMGYNPAQDLDKLVSRLEENHDLLKDVVVRGEGAEGAAALPRMLLDLLNQLDDKSSGNEQINETDESNMSANECEDTAAFANLTTASAQQIVGNLPKVWRVLMELLSHQSSSAGPDISEKSSDICYKSVETPAGPRLVPSVSKTYIRLKDLILEKKSLQKETNRLKQLNSHLENRLKDQERRLGLVSSELSKTWRIVGKMQRAHQQLHTHEKILRYELQQKRKMLTELKEQLEFCKEKWDRAKQKNSQSQIEWDKLRLEFKSRKLTSVDSINNSAESGYSDEKPSDSSDSSDDEGDVSERRRSRRKTKSPETTREIINPIINFLKTEEVNDDSDAVQDSEDLPLDGNDILSDGDSQANMADTEDQSVSETNPVVENDLQERESHLPLLTDVLKAGSNKLKQLEKRCHFLATKVEKANHEGVELCTKLEELQNQYGGGGTDEPSTSKEYQTARIENDQTKYSESCESQNECVNERLNQSNNVDADNARSTPPNKYIQDYEARFAARDARLKRMEEQTKSLVKKVANTPSRSVAINFKLDELHNVYGRSEETQSAGEDDAAESKPCVEKEEPNIDKELSQSDEVELTNETEKEVSDENVRKFSDEHDVETVESNQSKHENEIESKEHSYPIQTSEIVQKLHTTEDSSEQIKQQGDINKDMKNCGSEIVCSTSTAGSSFDNVSDYEARFAARDERLKRMEELAKSLVKQVSDTTTRGVKMGFKLDELHNVYGRSEDQNIEGEERNETVENAEDDPKENSKPDSGESN